MEYPPYHPFRSAEAKATYLAAYIANEQHWPIESLSRTVETSYGPTFLRISGPADAPPLVLLPGLRGNSLMWVPNIAALSESYRTYALDNIYDYGRSVNTRPIQGADDLTNWLEDLFTVLDLGGEINLLGLSNGGWLVSLCLKRFPERLNKVVLIAPASTVLPLRAEFLLRAMLSTLPARLFNRKLMYWLFDDLVQINESGRLLVENMLDDWALAGRCYKNRIPIQPTVLSDDELQGIQIPVLYLVGEHEKIYDARRAVRRLNNVAPFIQTDIIPSAGHDLTFVQANMVNRKVLAFLAAPSLT